MKEEELHALRKDVLRCFDGAAESTKCKLKITEKMSYKGCESDM